MAWPWRRSRPRPPIDPGDGAVQRHEVDGALLASAALVSRRQVRTVLGQRQPWQAEAWDLYDRVSEIKSGTRWASNACSRARLYVGRVDPDGSSEPAPIDAQDEDEDQELVAQLLAPLNELAGGQDGQSEMLRRMSILLDVPGEMYLVGYDDEQLGRRWVVASPSEIQSGGGGRIHLASQEIPGAQIRLHLDSASVIRIWHPHAQWAARPDSPMQALLDPLRELQGLSGHVMATTDSRLAGAGLLLASQDVVPAKMGQSEGVNPAHGGALAQVLLEAMATPLKDRDSAASIVPLLLTAPGDVKDKVEHLTFATELDTQVLPLRESAIRRVAVGMDMPPEQLLGMGDINHWGAWLIEASGIKLHIRPKLGLLCQALTSRWYRPSLRALGVDRPEQYVIWHNTAALERRPDNGLEAAQAHERGLLSDISYLRALGYSRDDMPDDAEQERRTLLRIALAHPHLAPPILAELGITVPGLAEAAAAMPRRTTTTAPAAPAAEPQLSRPGPPAS
ncbi:hypothetical protein ACFV5N_00835 [Streptomyces sp. NPDC059853]|uniref:hypothetical protein n=1 Tax=Streptomyces sp. NPDC059853 TaxID=3346973 RepID=UPI003659EB7B